MLASVRDGTRDITKHTIRLAPITAAGVEAGSHSAVHAALPRPSRSAGSVAHATAGTGRHSVRFGYRRLDGTVETRGMAGKRETHLPVVYRRRLNRANQVSQEDSEPIPRAARAGDGSESALEHGLPE